MSPATRAWVAFRFGSGELRLISDLFLTAMLGVILVPAARAVGFDDGRAIASLMTLFAMPQAARGASLFAAQEADRTLAEWFALPRGVEGVFAAESAYQALVLALRAVALAAGLWAVHLRWGATTFTLLALVVATAAAAQAASAWVRWRGIGPLLSVGVGVALSMAVVVAERSAAYSAAPAVTRLALVAGLMVMAAALWAAVRAELRNDRWRLSTLRT
jgi:hypothetical protein